MKTLCKFHLCLLLVLFGCGIQNIRKTDTTTEKIDTGELTFMTFNIRAGGGIKNPGMSPYRVEATEANLRKIAAAINSVNPDIVGLQEVRGFYQAKFIAEQLNLNYAYSVHANKSWWGLAVLSKYKIIDTSIKTINFDRSYGDRIALMCRIDINGRTLTVVNVHYALENYKEQVKSTMSFLNRSEDPIVLLGDFNRRPASSEIVPIREKLIATCEAAESYIGRCAGTGFGKIDYIFADQNNFKVLDAGLVLRKHQDASDHIAYWAKLRLNE
jgi:endonuclease/exonuclease/phosphatase family metal-dependent hydrolase